jgi:hypothetical protein
MKLMNDWDEYRKSKHYYKRINPEFKKWVGNLNVGDFVLYSENGKNIKTQIIFAKFVKVGKYIDKENNEKPLWGKHLHISQQKYFLKDLNIRPYWFKLFPYVDNEQHIIKFNKEVNEQLQKANQEVIIKKKKRGRPIKTKEYSEIEVEEINKKSFEDNLYLSRECR